MVAYPIAIYFGLTRLSARGVGLMIAAFVIPSAIVRATARGSRSAHDKKETREHLLAVLPVPLSIGALAGLTAWLDDERFVFATPVLINIALLITFGATLRSSAMPMIERFARLQEKDGLTDGQVAHCRQFTWIWCAFFIVNGGIAAALALRGEAGPWAAYNGGIAYGLIGALFTLEFIVRRVRFAAYGPGLHDRLLRPILTRLFPRASES